MTIRTFRGDSPPVAQVTKVTPSNVVAGDTFTITCNGKPISYVSAAGTAADVVNGLAAAIAANVQGIPEFTEFTALAVPAATPGPNDGSVLLLTAGTPGVPFTITTSTLVTSAGNITVVETTAGKNPVNEVHQIALVGNYTGGTFTITYSFGTTGAIAYNASAATVQTALAALAGVGAGNVLVTGGPGPATPWIVSWVGALSGTSVAPGTINGASLTGAGGVTIATTTVGAGKSSSIQWIGASQAAAGVFTLTFQGQTTGNIAFNATPATIQTALQGLSSIGAGNCLVYGVGGGTGFSQNKDYWFVVFTGALAGVDVPLLTVNQFLTPNGNQTGAFMIQRGGQTTADEFQIIDLGGAGGGTFTLTYGGVTTGDIDCTGVTTSVAFGVQNALGAIPAIGSGNVTVYTSAPSIVPGPATDSILVRFTAGKANTRMQLLTVNGAGLIASSGATVTRLELGQANTTCVQTVTVLGTGGHIHPHAQRPDDRRHGMERECGNSANEHQRRVYQYDHRIERIGLGNRRQPLRRHVQQPVEHGRQPDDGERFTPHGRRRNNHRNHRRRGGRQ